MATFTAAHSVRDWARAVDFYKTAFGAVELFSVEGGGDRALVRDASAYFAESLNLSMR
jgi:uncharacterized glyoxalase superfamily protein PhnB